MNIAIEKMHCFEYTVGFVYFVNTNQRNTFWEKAEAEKKSDVQTKNKRHGIVKQTDCDRKSLFKQKDWQLGSYSAKILQN